MGRQRRTPTAFSFFSFQDLITGLSGLMIFLVLLLLIDQLVSPAQTLDRTEAPKSQVAISVQEKIKRLEAEMRKWEALPEQVILGMVQDDGKKQVVLIEYAAERIAVQAMHFRKPPRVLASASESDRRRLLLMELAAFPPQQNDLLVLIKTSAFQTSTELIGLLRSKGYQVGFEPLEENRSALTW